MRVAGAVLRVTARVPHSALVAPPLLGPFLARRGGDLRLELEDAPPPATPDGAPLFESGGLWRVYASGARRLYVFHDDPDAPPSRAALVTADWSEGTLYVPRRRGHFALEYPLDEIAFRDYLAYAGALVLHAAAVLVRGRAVVFFGHSGAGKSTTTALWKRHSPDARILSDDRVVIRLRRGVPWVWGTPWHGSGRHASPGSAPLEALFLLEQAKTTEVDRIPYPAATAEVLARGFPPIWDEEAVARVLHAADEITSRAPVYRLRFRPTAEAVAAVRDALVKPGTGAAR